MKVKVSYSFIYSTSIYRVTTLLGTVPGYGDNTQPTKKQTPHSLPRFYRVNLGGTDVEAGVIVPCGKCYIRGPGWRASQMPHSLQGDSRSQVRASWAKGATAGAHGPQRGGPEKWLGQSA